MFASRHNQTSERRSGHSIDPRKVAVGGALALVLAACSPHTSANNRGNSSDADASCDPLTVSLSAGLQSEIVKTGTWPAKLSEFPHTGKIRIIQLAAANGLLPGVTDPSLDTAHKVVNAFEEKFDSRDAVVEIMPPNTLVREGEFLLTEFDQNCPTPVVGASPRADQTA